jgi:hypothetical protein
MVPLIHISNENDCVHDKNVIVSLSDFLFQILNVMVFADSLFKIFMVTVIADHWSSFIFHVVIAPLAKINFKIRYTHLYCHTTMDDNTNKKKAHKVDSSNDADPDPEQEGQLPHPFTMEDKRVK